MQQAGRRRNETQANDKLGDERGGGGGGGGGGGWVMREGFIEFCFSKIYVYVTLLTNSKCRDNEQGKN